MSTSIGFLLMLLSHLMLVLIDPQIGQEPGSPPPLPLLQILGPQLRKEGRAAGAGMEVFKLCEEKLSIKNANACM